MPCTKNHDQKAVAEDPRAAHPCQDRPSTRKRISQMAEKTRTVGGRMSGLQWDDSRPMTPLEVAIWVLLVVAVWFGLPVILGVGMILGWW